MEEKKISNQTNSNEKEQEMIKIMRELTEKLKDLDLGLPISVLYQEIKKRGIYQSDYFIAEKMRKFEKNGLIKLNGWNVILVEPSQ